jgi:hypothetical protein
MRTDAHRLPKNIRLKRRRPNRNAKKRFVVVCEGQNTEPRYFDALAQLLRLQHAESLISLVTIGIGGTPGTVADRALAEQRSLKRDRRKANDSFTENDEVWAIFDRDRHPDFDRAVQVCTANGVGIGRSNPCFEVWLILHEQDYDRPGTSAEIERACEKICNGYSRRGSKTADILKLLQKLDNAERRAATQLQRRSDEGSPFGPLSTTVHHLTIKLRTKT